MDLLDIDDQYQLMLDDALEAKFDQEAIEKLNSLPRDAQLPDMTAELEKWVQDEYQRGIEGAVTENRVRITERQLRRIIREQLTETIEKLANGKFRLYSKKKDPKTGRTYYVNKKTRESSWTKPAGLVKAVNALTKAAGPAAT